LRLPTHWIYSSSRTEFENEQKSNFLMG